VEGREAERLEEDEVLNALPIYLVHGLLPMELKHLAPAIDRLKARNVIELLPNGGGMRWAVAAKG
jgi:hypothetical protein